MEESDDRKLEELSVDEVVELIAEVIEAKLLLYQQLVSAGSRYRVARERLEETRESISSPAHDSLVYSTANSVKENPFLMTFADFLDLKVLKLFEDITLLSEEDTRINHLYQELMVSYFKKISFQYTSSKEKEHLVQNQPLQEPYSQTQ